MASVAELTVDPIEFEKEVKRRDTLAEATRHLYFIAARRIQVNDSCSKIIAVSFRKKGFQVFLRSLDEDSVVRAER